MTEALPLLLDLDGQPVAERWISDEEDKASSNEDEEFPELRGPFCSEQGDPAFQGLQPPQSTPLPALWDLGEAKTAVVSGDVVPGPDQSGHAGDLFPPHPILGSSSLGMVGESLFLLSPGLHLPRTVLAPHRLPQGAGAGDEQAPGAQAADSPAGAPTEGGDAASPHRPPTAARGAHGREQQPFRHSQAREGDIPGARLLATSLFCHQETMPSGFQEPAKHCSGREGGQSGRSRQDLAGWGPQHDQNCDQKKQEVKRSPSLPTKPQEHGETRGGVGLPSPSEPSPVTGACPQ